MWWNFLSEKEPFTIMEVGDEFDISKCLEVTKASTKRRRTTKKTTQTSKPSESPKDTEKTDKVLLKQTLIAANANLASIAENEHLVLNLLFKFISIIISCVMSVSVPVLFSI